MSTLIEYFNNDFKDLSLDTDITMTIQLLDTNKNIENEEKVLITRRVRHDMNSSCRLFTFYIPANINSFLIINNIIENLADHQKEVEGIESIGGYENDLQIGTHKSVFSNRVYFYIESELTIEEVTPIDNFCKPRNIFVTIRSQNYIKTRMKNDKPLAFISHDSRNKATIAKPLAMGLSSRLCSVWYDEFSLNVGQSLRESIEKGIKEAKKCILVLTPEFLQNPGWTKKEFNSIFTREMVFNERIVIPIWHKVSMEDIYAFSPSLADTVALIWPDSSEFSEVEYQKEVEILISKIHTAVND